MSRIMKPDIPHPDDFARTLRDVVGEKDRNKRAQAARRVLSAYTTLFYVSAEIQQESKEVSEESDRVRAAASTLAQVAKALVDQGITSVADISVPLSLEEYEAKA